MARKTTRRTPDKGAVKTPRQSTSPDRPSARDDRLTTGSNAPTTDQLTLEVSIGRKVRLLRQRLQITAMELATEAGLSPGMLSKIENGGTSPSLSTLQSLARALNVPLTSFFADFEERRDCSYVRAGQGVLIERRGTKSGHRYELLGHSISGDIVVEPYLITLSQDAEPYALFQHDGVEFIYMLTGKVVYRHADKLYPHGPRRRALLRRRRATRTGGARRAADDLSFDHHLSADVRHVRRPCCERSGGEDEA